MKIINKAIQLPGNQDTRKRVKNQKITRSNNYVFLRIMEVD